MNRLRSTAWVIGRGGLLGSALERGLHARGARLFVSQNRFEWADVDHLLQTVARMTDAFAAYASTAERWEIHWAAGVGTMSSDDASLVTETRALEALMAALSRSSLGGASGRLSFASSAGAIYAGSTAAVIDERTAERPTTPYARAKLVQETLIRDGAAKHGAGLLVARISTLYGLGQASAKAQGLLTHIARSMIRNQPVRIFVPLDTIRDYIAADEAAALMLGALDELEVARTSMKIFASEQPVTISEIVSIFKRLARRAPRIITSGSVASQNYTRRIQFRSIVPPLRSGPPVCLMAGIGRILAAERLRYVASGQTSVRTSSSISTMLPTCCGG